jgi:hypothetical protein
MSVIKETLRDVNLHVIPERIAVYEQLIDSAEPLFKLHGKGLEDLIKEHAQNLMFYDVMLQECKTIEETIKSKIEEIESQLYRFYNEGQQLKLGQRDIVNYIKGDDRYVKAYEILLEVSHTRRRLEAVVEALKSLGWSLNNIVKVRVAQVHDITL